MAGTRKTQNVATSADRKRVMLWMSEEYEGRRDEKLPSRPVKRFPIVFRGDLKSNLLMASQWAKIRDEYIAEIRRCENAVYRALSGLFKRVRMKAR
jgi:hypothetical protein